MISGEPWESVRAKIYKYVSLSPWFNIPGRPKRSGCFSGIEEFVEVVLNHSYVEKESDYLDPYSYWVCAKCGNSYYFAFWANGTISCPKHPDNLELEDWTKGVCAIVAMRRALL